MKESVKTFLAQAAKSRGLWLCIGIAAALLALHELALAWMEKSRAVEAFMSGSFANVFQAAQILAFVLLRAATFFLLPGIILYGLLSAALSGMRKKEVD